MEPQRIIQVKSREELRDEIHLTALDSVVILNFLCAAFTFIGLSLTTMELQSIDGCLGCGPKIRSLMLFEVISFAFFLASLLVAYGLKIMISLINAAELNKEFRNHFNRKSIRKILGGSRAITTWARVGSVIIPLGPLKLHGVSSNLHADVTEILLPWVLAILHNDEGVFGGGRAIITLRVADRDRGSCCDCQKSWEVIVGSDLPSLHSCPFTLQVAERGP
ncbi:hypothetical protein CK203_108009 [Vitis vinifera]|uniref:Uncharacterized protein n=1 Tax=Vitis vinifera TaxID=29760 RepID=A0A438C3V0_VITVI|nr:hypothetical protein CK203_108009 [Vitis vinifera]